jgi:hypothetical protein
MSRCNEAAGKATAIPVHSGAPITFSLFCCLIIFLFSTGYLEGQSPNSTSSGSVGQAQNQSQTPNPNQQTKQKKRDKGAADDVGAATSFSDAVAEDVLHVLMDGLKGHNEGRMLSVFDPDAMDAFLNFSNQVSAMFQQYDSFRVHYNIDQATADGTKGVALVDFEMEEASGSGNVQPVYKHEQIRFEMERSKKGWKIVDVKPRTFFS